jgi:D-arabinose 1-dehydrogenase-like Zn-dependent alcohol dehydrogenase
MKASVYYSKNDIRYEDIAVPEIGDGDMLIKMHSCGLCGTDIHKAQHQTVTGPVILGHEVSGEVVKVGKNVTRYRVGERVVTATTATEDILPSAINLKKPILSPVVSVSSFVSLSYTLSI